MPIMDGATALTSTKIPARRFNVRPNTGSSITTEIQNALNSMDPGQLVFEPGTYICNGVEVTRNDISLFLPPGALLTANSATPNAVIDVKGTVDTGSGTVLVIGPDGNYPYGGDRTIYVSTSATLPGDHTWIWIEDDEVSAAGVPSDPDLELWKHGELVQVRSTSSGVINLYSPLINRYAAEVLSNNQLTTGTNWSVANGFALSADTAVYTHSGSGGTLTQVSANFVTPVAPSLTYVLTYSITASTVSGGDLTLSGVSSATVTGLNRAVGTYRVTFTSHATPGNLVLTASSTSGSFTMDNIFLAQQSRIRAVTPVTGFRITGGGTITNEQAGSPAHGIRLFHAADARIGNIKLNRCWDSGVHATRSTEIKIGKNTFQNAVRFDSRGYGFTSHASSRITLVKNHFRRLRHCIDIATFSRLATATGNVMSGSTTGNLNTHPSVEGCTFTANIIDGAHGQDAASNSTEYGDSSIQASGINIDQKNKSIIVTKNEIRNCRLSGIYVDFGDADNPTEFVTIEGNIIENCQLFHRVSGSGGMTGHAGIALLETNAGGTNRRGIICRGNILREPGQYGITVGIDGALVEGNWIYKAEDKVTTGAVPVVGIGIWVKNSTSTGAPDGITVRGNIIEACKQNGIRVGVNAAAVNTTNTIVEGNRIKLCGTDGILVEETAPNTTLRNNESKSNVGNGITTQASDGWLTDNRVYNNTGWGIEIIAGGNNNQVKDNKWSGNTAGNYRDLATGTFLVQGESGAGSRKKWTTISSDQTLDADMYYIDADSTGGVRTITLPATNASRIGLGFTYIIKRRGGSNVVINRSSSNTIDGATSVTLAADDDRVMIVSNGGSGAAGVWDRVI